MQLYRLFHTIVHLRPIQLYYQLRYRLYRSNFKLYTHATTNSKRMDEWIDKYDCCKGDEFSFLNLSSSFSSWNDAKNGMLWAYNLNYMDYLWQPSSTVSFRKKWIDKFIADFDTNRVGQDPYPIALRGINWIKTFVANPELATSERLSHLYSQYKLLQKRVEYHLLGNHLLEDAYSLFFAAIYFEDNDFYRLSSKLLRRELKEQILSDGAHYEQSPMYHCILLDRLLDCYNISKHNIVFNGQTEMTSFLAYYAEKMLGHLESIIYKGGDYPFFNDAALGIAPLPNDLFYYARRLELTWQPIALRECGYRKLRNRHMECFLDVGNITATYQPGHSHADTFNFELRIEGSPLVVDTGISTYNKTLRREYERSTMAHNTVTIADKSSSEVWSGFRVAKRARVKIEKDLPNCVSASHNGYGRNTHHRTFNIYDEMLRIEDRVAGSTDAVGRIYLDPAVKVLSVTDKQVRTNISIINIEHAKSVTIKDCYISREYNKLNKTQVIECVFNTNMCISIERTLQK